MSALLLPALVAVAGALLALGPVAWAAGPWLAARGALGLCLVGALLAFVALLGGAHPTTLEIPIGLPGSGVLASLDGVSAFYLLLLFVAGAAVSAVAIDTASCPSLIGAIAATMLAADGFSVVLGFEATALAAALLVLGGAERFRPAGWLVGGGVFAGLCLVAAMALLAPLQPWGLDLSFAGMRAHPPEGFRATAMFFLTLLAVGGLAGLAPAQDWLPRAQTAASGPAGALLGGGILGAYLVARVAFDLAGPAQPGWWGAVPAVLGAAGACLAAAAAFRAADIRAVAAAAGMVPGGLAAMAFGLALAARAADLAALAALALGTALLLTTAQALAGTLLALAADVAETGAGTRRLDRLGGLLRGMPLTGACALLAAANLAALPPSAGFAAIWTLLQVLIGAARGGGVGWQMLAAVATLATAGAVALSALAAVRLVGIAFLGRPRTPRTAAAQEEPVAARAAMLSLAALALAAGVFPGAVPTLAAPALRALLGVDLADRVGWLGIAPSVGAPGLRAAALAVLLLAATLGTLRAQKLRAAVGHRAGAAWEGGGAPPPPWLPFGDPATQIGPAGFGEPVGNLLEAARPRAARRMRKPVRWWRAFVGRADAVLRPSPRASLAALAIVAILLLVAMLAVQA